MVEWAPTETLQIAIVNGVVVVTASSCTLRERHFHVSPHRLQRHQKSDSTERLCDSHQRARFGCGSIGESAPPSAASAEHAPEPGVLLSGGGGRRCVGGDGVVGVSAAVTIVCGNVGLKRRTSSSSRSRSWRSLAPSKEKSNLLATGASLMSWYEAR